MSDEILTIEETARLLKVTPATVIGLLDKGDLRGREIGGQWRTTRRAVFFFVDGFGVSGGAGAALEAAPADRIAAFPRRECNCENCGCC